MQFSVRFLFAIILACAIASLTIRSWKSHEAAIADGYAQYSVGVLVIQFMEEHKSWPKSWDELRIQFDQINGLEIYKERVRIDFTANVETLRRQAQSNDKPTFNVISDRYT